MSESSQLAVRCPEELLAALDDVVEDDRTPFANRSDAVRVVLGNYLGVEYSDTHDTKATGATPDGDGPGTFRCPKCNYQCTRGPSGIEYGHSERCLRRPDGVDPTDPRAKQGGSQR